MNEQTMVLIAAYLIFFLLGCFLTCFIFENRKSKEDMIRADIEAREFRRWDLIKESIINRGKI